MTEHPEDELATPEQLSELRSLAGPGDDIPDGMRAGEAAQRSSSCGPQPELDAPWTPQTEDQETADLPWGGFGLRVRRGRQPAHPSASSATVDPGKLTPGRCLSVSG